MSPASKNSFGARETMAAAGRNYEIYRLASLEKRGIDPVRVVRAGQEGLAL